MTWRQELARRDTLGPSDDLRDMVAALDWAGREKLRAWLITHQDAPDVEDPETLAAATAEIKELLPWVKTEELRCLVRVVRAFAERR